MPKLDPRLRRVRRATPPEPMPPSLRVPQAGRRRHPRRYPHSRSHPCTRHRCRTHGRRPSSCHRHGFHWDFSTLCMGGPHDVQLGDFRPPPTAVLSVTAVTGAETPVLSSADVVLPPHQPGRMSYAETMRWLKEAIPFPPMPTYADV